MTGAFGRIAAAAALAAAVAAGLTGAAVARDSLAGSYLAGRHANTVGDVEAAATHFAEALARDPDNLALTELALVNLIAAGRVEQAMPIARRLAAVEPDHRVANLAVAADDIRRGRFAEARALITARPEGLHPLVGRLMEGWAAFGAGDDAAAFAALAALEDRPVFRLFGRYHAGLMKLARGDAAGAVESLSAAVSEANGPTARLGLAYGAALEIAGRAPEARRFYEDALRRAPDDPVLAAALARLDAGQAPPPPVADAAQGSAEALYGLAGVLANETGRRLALAYARLGEHLWPELDSAALLVAEIFEAESQYDLAVDAYGGVPSASPLSAAAELGRAQALRRLERDEAAAEALSALIARAPRMVQAHVALGDLRRGAERWTEAAEAYSAAIALLSDAARENWAVYYQRGIAWERAGQWDKAEADFRKALALEPDQPLVLNYLGYSWVEMHRNLDEARAMIERAVELRPEDGYITDSLGWVLYKLGDYPGAVAWLEKAVELQPVDPVINDHLGDAYWKVGRRLEAEFQWKRARSFDPEPKDLARIKRKLAVGLDAVLEEEARAAAAPGPAAAAPDGG